MDSFQRTTDTTSRHKDRTMIHLAIFGANGRMGTRLCALAQRDDRFELTAALSRHTTEPDADTHLDVIIDFSSDAGTRQAIGLALAQRAALLVGTTGLSHETIAALEHAAKSVAVLIAPNTSLGVAVLKHLVTEAARRLGPGYQIDIIESHHAAKRDAPSGTAIRLADGIRHDGGGHLPDERIHAIRSGDVIGEHTIRFAGPGEYLECTHRATTRDLFVHGALRMAAWLADQQPGLHRIEAALGMAESGD